MVRITLAFDVADVALCKVSTVTQAKLIGVLGVPTRQTFAGGSVTYEWAFGADGAGIDLSARPSS